MSAARTIWGLLFRLFPCPTPIGLRRVGKPGPGSPVLVTCNFHLTVQRLTRVLTKAHVDAWLVVAESKGVNVWCAAGGDEFNTRTVVAAIKTCGVADEVDHRQLILPPMSAPGVVAHEVAAQTGWKTPWGPFYAADIPGYLRAGRRRDRRMKRARYHWRERLDTALGSMFPFYLFGAIGFALFGKGLLVSYLATGALTFLVFMLACPFLPGARGLTKVLWLEVPLGAALLASELMFPEVASLTRAELIIAMATLLVWSSELGGLASTMPSDLDPFLARLGIGAIGNVALAGSVRTELLNGDRKLQHDPETCDGCRQCVEICPMEVWTIGDDKRASMVRADACTACRGCLMQCPTGAIRAPRVTADAA